jgi:hypothetical protein
LIEVKGASGSVGNGNGRVVLIFSDNGIVEKANRDIDV